MKTAYPPLTTYRVHRDDGSSYVTNMAAGVTLEQAERYFLGNIFTDEHADGTETKWKAVRVEEVKDTQ